KLYFDVGTSKCHEILFSHRSLGEVIGEFLQCSDLFKKMTFRYTEERNASGERLFGSFMSADYVKDVQALVGDQNFIDVLLFSDETNATPITGLGSTHKYHPIVATVGNFKED